MSGAAPLQELTTDIWQATGTEGAPNLKQVAADRLAAHRQRRAAAVAQETELEARTRGHREALRTAKWEDQRRGASLVRDTVKARYERRESYREFLAAEAERAIAQAQAEAEIAARNARAVAASQMALLEELGELNRPDPGPREQALAQRHAETRGELAHALADIVLGARELMDEPVALNVVEALPHPRNPGLAPAPASVIREVSAAGLTVRLFEDMPSTPPRPGETTPRRGGRALHDWHGSLSEQEVTDTLTALEEEIDFRRAPDFAETMLLEMQPIPGNLIEFPRELVAPRRARPRLAEGPLHEGEEPQLRIFEVDAEQQPLASPALPTHQVPEWQTLQLDRLEAPQAASSGGSDAQTHPALPLQSASVERRLMAAAVDLCCVATAWVAAAACVLEVAGPDLRAVPLPVAAVAAVLTFLLYAIGYELLFFTFAEGTPGMRYARIALCTFGEGNPTRRAMRRRVGSTLLAACPLGLGLAWMLLDHDKLGWHDRMSRMYQRAY